MSLIFITVSKDLTLLLKGKYVISHLINLVSIACLLQFEFTTYLLPPSDCISLLQV